MAPTVEEHPRRLFDINLKSGETVHVWADRICRPGASEPMYKLKRGDCIVGEFQAEHVIGWSVGEHDA